MRDGICPTCAAAAVYAIVPTGHDGKLTIGPITSVVATLYICQACGYSETYFLSQADRDKLPDYGRRVPPAAS